MKTMFTKQFFAFLPLFCLFFTAFSQKTTISGIVKDADSKEPLVGISVTVKNESSGAITDAAGHFELKTDAKLPLTVVFSAVGFIKQEVTVNRPEMLNISLAPSAGALQQVVVSASRTEENILRAPVSIEKMDATAVRISPSLSYFDALQNVKSLDMVTSGLTYKVINTRGFNDTGNARFLQLTDGVDNQSAGLGFTPGNQFGTSDLDVESVELIPGSASALYGPVAFNGLLQTKTKNPWDYQGLSVQTKVGINHVGDADGAKPLYELSARYAKAFNNHFAFKLNASYFAGTDWYATDYTDVNYNTPANQRGDNNPARNALNIYGDEVSKTIDSVGTVSRTGYAEKDLSDYNAYSAKFGGSLHYRFGKNLEAIYALNYNQGTANYTGSSRYVLDNFAFTQQRLELRGSHFFIRAYSSAENSHDSYSTRLLGQQLDRTWVRDLSGNLVTSDKADDVWFDRYAAAFKGQINGVAAQNANAARDFADQGRYLPGSDGFNREKDRLVQTAGLQGAGILSKSKLYHIDGQYDLSSLVKVVDLQIGGNYRLYDMNTEGTLFNDKDQKVTNSEYGAFAQVSKSVLQDKLRLIVSGRYDKNESFDGRFTPRASLVFSPKKNHNFRASYQSGFRNPTVGDQFISLNVGPIVILGGAPANSKGWNAYENSVTAASVGAFFGAFQGALQGGASPDQAIAATKDVLQKSNVAFLKPERNQTYEIGYKGLLGDSWLLDANYYYSNFTDFIINQVVIRTQNPVLGSDGKINPAAVGDFLSGQTLAFQLYTNAADKVSTQGVTLGLTYLFGKGYRLHGNTTWSEFNILEANPNNIPAFNTPTWKANFSLSNTHLTSRIGASIAWHWQESFDWYGTLNELHPGTIPAYNLFDAQVSYHIPGLKTTVKLGANNLTNKYIVQAYGSPSVGGIYYLALTFDASK